MVKVISLSDKAYSRLKDLKHGTESFSDVVLGLVEKKEKRSILDFAGMWRDKPEFDKIFSDIEKNRKNFKLRDVKI